MLENPNNEMTTKSSKKRNVPVADLNFSTLLTNVSAKYATCGITLPWISGQEAINLANDFRIFLEERLTQGSQRKPITQQLREQEVLQDKSVSFVKAYLMEKYGKVNALSYYGELGLEKNNSSYRLPVDADRRLEALRKMEEGLERHGFITQAYGLSFWKNLRIEYIALATAARQKDSTVTSKVSHKNMLKEKGKKFIGAMIALIAAMYPDDTKAKLREWGFHKEKY